MIQCKECKQDFKPYNQRIKYCSDECRQKHRKRKKKDYEKKYRKTQKYLDSRKRWRMSKGGKKSIKNYQKRNKERITNNHKVWCHNQRLKVINMLGGKCANPFNIDHSDFEKNSNYIECLQIDHINGGGAKERKQFNGNAPSYYSYLIKKIKTGSKEYQCLCANCNWIKRVINNELSNN